MSSEWVTRSPIEAPSRRLLPSSFLRLLSGEKSSLTNLWIGPFPFTSLNRASPPRQVFESTFLQKKRSPSETMHKMRGFFTPDSRRRESKPPVLIPTDNIKRQDKDNAKTGSPRRPRSRRAKKEEAKRRWKLVRNICIAFRIRRRCNTEVTF